MIFQREEKNFRIRVFKSIICFFNFLIVTGKELMEFCMKGNVIFKEWEQKGMSGSEGKMLIM